MPSPAVAARRARHDMAGQRAGDQEADGAVGARHVVLAAAMDGAGGEHQLVAHQHDAALDLGGMLGELVRRAAAEIDHLGGEPVLAGRDGAHQRMTRRHRRRRAGAGSRSWRCQPLYGTGIERPEFAGEAARTRSRSKAKAFFSLAVPASRPPQSQMSLKSRHRLGIGREPRRQRRRQLIGGHRALPSLDSSNSRKAAASTDGSRSRRWKTPIS